MKTFNHSPALLCQTLLVLMFGVALNTAQAKDKPSAASTLAAPTTAVAKARVGTGFGISGFRGFNTNANTRIFLDGELLPAGTDINAFGLGTRVNVNLAANANTTVTEGDADDVFIDTALRGPITAVTPQLRVLGQAVTVTADTVLVGFATIASAAVSNNVEVFGQIDANNSFVATRIARLNTPNAWRITGFVTALNATGVSLGSQAITTTGVTLENCQNPITVGSYVEVRALPIANFTNQAIDTVQRFRCGQPFVQGAVGAPVVLDGLIGMVVSDTQFKINNITVNHGPSTLFRNGSADDLDLAVRVEVEGIYTATNVVQANKIRFLVPAARAEAPIVAADVVPNVSIRVLGKTFKITAQTRDDDGIGANGVTAATQVRVRGYIDRDGNLFATRIIGRGAPRPSDFGVTGPIAAVNATTQRFTILGVNVDASASVYQDANGATITAAVFYAALSPSQVVQVEDATYNSTTNTLTGGIVQIEDDNFANRQANKAVQGATISGVLSEAALDTFYQNGFE
jgi:hypothetical protein